MATKTPQDPQLLPTDPQRLPVASTLFLISLPASTSGAQAAKMPCSGGNRAGSVGRRQGWGLKGLGRWGRGERRAGGHRRVSSVQPRPRPSVSSPQAGHEDLSRDRLVLGRQGAGVKKGGRPGRAGGSGRAVFHCRALGGSDRGLSGHAGWDRAAGGAALSSGLRATFHDRRGSGAPGGAE